MNVKEILKFSMLPALVVLLAGCVNLRVVNEFATGSAEGLKKFEALPYSFTRACADRCEIEQLENAKLLRESCPCTSDNEADSVTHLIYNALKGYFDGLARLSGNEMTAYKFDAVSKALNEGNFGEVKLNKDHVEAYANISGILSRTIADGYRKRKLSLYIGEANDAVRTLLSALEFNLVSNLSRKLDVKKQRVTSYYFDLFNEASVSAYEKKKIIEDYNQTLADIDSRKKQINVFDSTLNAVAEGHQQLFVNRHKLKTKEAKILLSQYGSNIRDIIDQFNVLKNID